MTADIFEHWFTHHFLVHAPGARPLLLLLDGHSTHYSPSFITKAAHEKVIVFCLPPNTTHITQPLDKGAFGPLKTYWHQECQHYMSRNSGKVITQYEFMQVFSKAWYRAMTPIGAFKTTGVFPLNRNVVEVAKATPIKSFQPEALSKKTGLAFIPLYSPDCERCSCSNSSHSSDQMSSSEDDFTEEERIRFRRRYEEGYDIKTDNRYNLWLKKCSQNAGMSSSTSNLLLNEGIPTVTVLQKFLKPPAPPQIRTASSYEKTSGKVLTSVEHRKCLEEKERLKKEKEAEKERKKRERERKKEERLKEKERKKQERKRR